MALVIYVQPDGTRHRAKVGNGETVMRGAIDNMIEGIVGECGGGLACATCHCYVDEAWFAKVGSPCGAESDMLDSAASERRPTSRLSCQISVSGELDGLVVHLPEAQI